MDNYRVEISNQIFLQLDIFYVQACGLTVWPVS